MRDRGADATGAAGDEGAWPHFSSSLGSPGFDTLGRGLASSAALAAQPPMT
jgi:hypothetical protein